VAVIWDKPWFNNTIRYLIKLYKHYTVRFTKTGNLFFKELRNQYRREVKAHVGQARKIYYDKKVKILCNPQLNPKKYWSTLKWLCGNQS